MSSSSLSLSVRSEHGVTVIKFGPEFQHLDETLVDTAGRQLQGAVQAVREPRVVLDMSYVSFFGSSFIEMMMRAWRTLQGKSEATMAIAGLQPYCREVLEVTHLDRLWPTFDTPEQAVAKLAAKS